MSLYLLDTNVITHLVKGNAQIRLNLAKVAPKQVVTSSLVYAELCYGLAKKPEATRLQRAVMAVMSMLTIVPFDESASEHYGRFRASLDMQGKALAPLDLLIASHASYLGATLVSNDGAFVKVAEVVNGFAVVDWAV